jgi:hypothetical protein
MSETATRFEPNFPLPQTIQQEAYKLAKEGLLKLLAQKTRYIKQLENKELSESSFKRIEVLRQEVQAIGSYMMQFDDFLHSVYELQSKDSERAAMLDTRCKFLQTELLDYIQKYHSATNQLIECRKLKTY